MYAKRWHHCKRNYWFPSIEMLMRWLPSSVLIFFVKYWTEMPTKVTNKIQLIFIYPQEFNNTILIYLVQKHAHNGERAFHHCWWGRGVDRHGRTLHIIGNWVIHWAHSCTRATKSLQQNTGSEFPPTKARGRMETKLVVLPSKTYHFSGNPLLCRPSFWF